MSRNNAAAVSRGLGRFERSIVAAQEAIRLDPYQYHPYYNLMASEVAMNRWSEAKKVYEQAVSRGLDSFKFHNVLYLIAFLDRDVEGIQRELEWEKTDPRASGEIFLAEASRQLYFGHAKVAKEFLSKGVNKKTRAGLLETAAGSRCRFAWKEVELGYVEPVRQMTIEALRTYPAGLETKVCVAFVQARAGDPSNAETMAGQVAAEWPHGTLQQAILVPSLEAAAMLAKGKPAEALRLLEPSVPYFGADLGWLGSRDSAYLRGVALLQLQQGKEAALEFQKLIDSPGGGGRCHIQAPRTPPTCPRAGDDGRQRRCVQVVSGVSHDLERCRS